MKLVNTLIVGLIVSIIAFILLITDLIWVWIPVFTHGEGYTAKVSTASTAASVLVAFMIAILAALTIRENKELRREGRRREEYDRKERYLNEIIEWANDLNTHIYGIDILGETRSTEDRKVIWILAGLGNKGKYILAVAERIFGNRLKDSIKATGNAAGIYAESLIYINNRTFEIIGMLQTEIDSIVRELDEAIAEDQRNTTSLEISTTKQDIILQKHAESLRDKAITTLSICAEIKADLLIK